MRKLAISIVALTFPGFEATAAQLSLDQVIGAAHAAGFACGEPLAMAVAVAVAESSLNPRSKNLHPEYGMGDTGNVHIDRGLWQISSYWWPAYTDA